MLHKVLKLTNRKKREKQCGLNDQVEKVRSSGQLQALCFISNVYKQRIFKLVHFFENLSNSTSPLEKLCNTGKS